MSQAFAAGIGYLVCGVLGVIVVGGVLGFLVFVTGLIGEKLFKDLRRVYSLTVITYWLARLEREGTHTFERARKEVSPPSPEVKP